MDIKATLSKQIGPFPLGVWILVVAGGIGIGLYSRRGGFGSSTDTSSGDAETTTVGGTMVGGVPTTVGNANGGTTTTPTTTTTTPSTNTLGQPILGTNDEWYQWASTVLIGRGFSAGATASALGKYLQGYALTGQEQAIVDAALQYAGVTPQLLPVVQRENPVQTAPNASDTPSQTPPVTHDIPPVVDIPRPAASAAISVPATIAAALAPAAAVQIPNPIAGDTSTVVAGKTADGNTFIYGGSAQQAAALTSQTPAPVAQVALPPASGVGQQYTTPDGFKFTFG